MTVLRCSLSRPKGNACLTNAQLLEIEMPQGPAYKQYVAQISALCFLGLVPANAQNTTSGPIHSKRRVKVLELDTGIFGRELPVGLGVVAVTITLPGGDLLGEGFDIGDATVEAL